MRRCTDEHALSTGKAWAVPATSARTPAKGGPEKGEETSQYKVGDTVIYGRGANPLRCTVERIALSKTPAGYKTASLFLRPKPGQTSTNPASKTSFPAETKLIGPVHEDDAIIRPA